MSGVRPPVVGDITEMSTSFSKKILLVMRKEIFYLTTHIRSSNKPFLA